MQVHPEVRHALRPYHPAAELDLFCLARVDWFLSQFAWHYKVTSVGQVSIQGNDYGLGSAHADKTVDVRFDGHDRCLIFSEIAVKLNISVKTAKTHRSELMRRLDLHDIASLVRYAMQIGLVPPEEKIE